MREEYSAGAEVLREHGLEVDAFVADCDEFIAVLEGRHDGDYDVQAFIVRLNAFKEEASEFMHIQQQVKVVEMVGNLHDLLPQMERMAAACREWGEPMDLRTAVEIEGAVARIRAGLEEGRLDKEAMQDMQLAAAGQMAEIERRLRFREAACALYWEQWPPERWAKLSPEERLKLEGVLEAWRRDKEKVLGVLPLEDRRRLEAMRYEDFDKPGACDP